MGKMSLSPLCLVSDDIVYHFRPSTWTFELLQKYIVGMPRARRKTVKGPASMFGRVNYRESSDTSDDEYQEPGLLTNILGLLMNMQRKSAQKKNKKKTTRQPKRKQSSGGCDCINCTVPKPKKQRCTTRKSVAKDKTKSGAPSTDVNASFNLDSDDEEVVGTNITETQEDNIKSKVDNFFKALDSDEDELESKLAKRSEPPQPAEKKTKDFYTLLSDSEDEKEKPSTSANTTITSFSEPSTSGFSNHLHTGVRLVSHTPSGLKPEKKPEDLFAYVDDILNDCNIIDMTDDKPKENIPVESLEDLKKKTEEILGSVTSLIDDIKPKPKEPEKKAPASPEKEAPSCPICLEILGGSRQAMSTFCGHMFCEPCIAQVARTSKKCPTCRKGVTKAKYHPVYI